MINKNIFFYSIILLMVYSQLLLAENNNTFQHKLEVRVLIDGSYAMTKKDPQEIRLGILKEITKVLPNDTLAGVWVFSDTAQKIIPDSMVDKQWIAKSELIIDEFNNKGTYKNLGEALETITVDWTEPSSVERKVLLVTDGFINVFGGDKENNEAKAHLINSVIPYCIRNNIKLYILGISDTINENFLQELTSDNKGSYHRLTKETNVNWLLLKIFDQSLKIGTTQLEKLPSKAAPIEEHYFTIEESLNEINLLVFKEKATDLLALKTPSGKVLDKDTISKKLKWKTDNIINFITVKRPRLGKWTIIGNLDKWKKFIVIDNLNIEILSLPGDVFIGESFMITACLADNGKIVNNKDFLDSIKFNVSIKPESSLIEPYYFDYKGKKNGNYSLQLGPFNQMVKEPVDINLNFIGKTFQRNKHQTITILPVPVKVQTYIKVDKDGRQIINVEAIPDGNILDLKNINLSVTVENDKGTANNYTMFKAGDKWVLPLVPRPNVIRYVATINITGETTLGRYVELSTKPMVIMVPQVTLPDPVIIKVIETVVDGEKQENTDKSSSRKEESEEYSVVSIILLFVVGGLVSGALLVGLVFAMRIIKNKQQVKFSEIMSKFGGD